MMKLSESSIKRKTIVLKTLITFLEADLRVNQQRRPTLQTFQRVDKSFPKAEATTVAFNQVSKLIDNQEFVLYN